MYITGCAGEEDRQTLQRLYKDLSLRFLNNLSFEPQSILVTDTGAGLETALLASIFPAASIFCATTEVHGVLQTNIGSLTNVETCSNTSMRCTTRKLSAHSITEGAVPDDAGLEGSSYDIILVSAKAEQSVLQAAGLSSAEALSAAKMTIVDSNAWQLGHSSEPFKRLHRTFFMGWDIFTSQPVERLFDSAHPPQKTLQVQAAQSREPKQQQVVKVFYHVAAKDHYRCRVDH